LDASLSDHEERMFEVWRFSPTVHSNDRTELVLAFKIGRELLVPGSRVLKALRQVPGVDPAIVERVEAFVQDDPKLGYDESGEMRRIVLLS